MPACGREGQIFLFNPYTHDRFFFVTHFSFLNVDILFLNVVSSIADLRHIVAVLLWRLLTSLRSVT